METENKVYQTITDSTDANNVYYGYADLGRGTDVAKWRIKKKVTAGSVVSEVFPIGENRSPSNDFEFIWDNRASLKYSFTDDLAKPTLSTVSIASDNVNTAVANPGDTVTLTIVSNEDIQEPSITIDGIAATIVAGVDAQHWTATLLMDAENTVGVLGFAINFEDIVGNEGDEVIATTDESEVTFAIV